MQLLLVKVLAFCQPLSILELGSGQTTKLLANYGRQFPLTQVLTLEQNAQWHERLQNSVELPANHSYRLAPLALKQVTIPSLGRRIETEWYSGTDVEAEVSVRRFDLVIVDGPDHGQPGMSCVPFSRSGVLALLPASLSESFVLIVDDVDRYGELMTVRLIEDLFRVSGRSAIRFDVHGTKTQVVFCSPDRAFLQST
jgi:hypothetical protein